MWQCHDASKEEILKYENITSCPSPNMQYVDCEPPEPITCRVHLIPFLYFYLEINNDANCNFLFSEYAQSAEFFSYKMLPRMYL